jgi:peptidoglycan/xylan/chitin deacetylase (PgdA/CDA1 family)
MGKWGPDGKQAAVSITFDNLGEASDIEFGRWPTHVPVGRHHSVVRDLPAVLEAIAGTRATFFVEAWNLHVYPDAIKSIVDAGHEIGSHGMRHEIWCNLTPDQEYDHLRRCVDDYARFGIEIKGLRPPGGIAASSSKTVLPDLGLNHISLVGVQTGVTDNGLAVLESVNAAADVSYYAPAFAKYRNHEPGDHVVTPDVYVEGMLREIENAVSSGGYISTLSHPFYLSPTPQCTDAARAEALKEVVQRVTEDPRIWVATTSEISTWMLDHRLDFPETETLDPPADWNPSFYKDIRR